MNTTCESIDYIDIGLISIGIIEQFLSFSATNLPKSCVQLIMFILYRIYKTIMYKPDDTISTNTKKTSKSYYSINIGDY